MYGMEEGDFGNQQYQMEEDEFDENEESLNFEDEK